MSEDLIISEATFATINEKAVRCLESELELEQHIADLERKIQAGCSPEAVRDSVQLTFSKALDAKAMLDLETEVKRLKKSIADSVAAGNSTAHSLREWSKVATHAQDHLKQTLILSWQRMSILYERLAPDREVPAELAGNELEDRELTLHEFKSLLGMALWMYEYVARSWVMIWRILGSREAEETHSILKEAESLLGQMCCDEKIYQLASLRQLAETRCLISKLQPLVKAANPEEALNSVDRHLEQVKQKEQAERAQDQARAHAEEQAWVAAQKAEEEERRQKARQERDHEREVYMAKMAAEKEEARQKEQAELLRKRREAGLAADEDEKVVQALCTLRRGFGDAHCIREGDDFEIRGLDKYVTIVCTDGCKLTFHQVCWREAEKACKDQHMHWKLKRGAQCPTDGCPGTVTYSALQSGSESNPSYQEILVHKEKRQSEDVGEKDKGRHAKAKKKDRERPKEHLKEHPKAADVLEQARPQRDDLRRAIPQQDQALPKKENKEAQLGEKQQDKGNEPSTQKKEDIAKMPPIDISNLDLEQLRPVGKDDHELGGMKAKKEKRFKPQKQKAIIQPDLHFDIPKEEEAEPIEDIAPRNRPANTFFDDLEQERAQGVADEPFLDVGRNIEFPDLEEATLQQKNPELFAYIHNVEDVIAKLLTDDGRSSRSLFIKNLDLGYLEDTGQHPMMYLRDLLYVFGSVCQLRLFNLLAAACVQFKSEDQAKLAQSSLHDTHQLGNRRVSVRFLDLYPSDAILEARLGLEIWDMFRSSESDFSSLSTAKTAQKEKEIRQLNAAAKEFVPKSFSSQPDFLSEGQEDDSFANDLAAAQEASLLPAPKTQRDKFLAGFDKQGTGRAFQQQESLPLPDYMSEFTAMEVIGCNSESLEQYLGQDGAFGVHPNQLKGEGWVARTPTALALFHIEELTLHGLWKVTGRQISNGTQIATVEPVDTFPALEEPLWQDLMVFNETEDADGYIGYVYPQALGKKETRAMVQLFWEAKHPTPPPTAAASSSQAPRTVSADEAEALEILRRNQEDEALARKMQRMMDDEGLREEEDRNMEAARRLQEEENRAANPSYLAAAQQKAYRLAPKKLLPSAPAKPADNSDIFDLFFPTVPTPPRSPPAATKAPTTAWKQNSVEHLPSWSAHAGDQNDNSNAATVWDDALFQHDRPSSPKTPAAFHEATSETYDSQEDILALLGIAPAAPSPDTSKQRTQTESPEQGPKGTPPMDRRTSSNVSSKETDDVPENDSKSRTRRCALCEQNAASYICLPCRHWGPCTSCVPTTKDKDVLYPTCLRCEAGYNCLVRVYKR